MTEQARIVDIQDQLVVLSCLDNGSCAACAGKSFCNVQGRQYTAVNSRSLDISRGDDVEVYLPPGKTIFSGFMVMMVPLAGFAAGYLLTSSLGSGGEGINALGGFAGLAAGFGIAWLYGASQKKRGQPEITKVIKKGISPSP